MQFCGRRCLLFGSSLGVAQCDWKKFLDFGQSSKLLVYEIQLSTESAVKRRAVRFVKIGDDIIE